MIAMLIIVVGFTLAGYAAGRRANDLVSEANDCALTGLRSQLFLAREALGVPVGASLYAEAKRVANEAATLRQEADAARKVLDLLVPGGTRGQRLVESVKALQREVQWRQDRLDAIAEAMVPDSQQCGQPGHFTWHGAQDFTLVARQRGPL